MNGDSTVDPLDSESLEFLDRALPAATAAPAAALLRQELLDLAEAPRLPIDLDAFEWQELFEGVRVAVLREDPARNMRGCLIWAKPGAMSPLHRHKGSESLLVLQGGLKDHRGSYHAGQVCRSVSGSVHSEEALPGEDCVLYAVYYGDHEQVG